MPYGSCDATTAGEAYAEVRRLIRKEIKKAKQDWADESMAGAGFMAGKVNGLEAALKCVKQAVENVDEG